MFWLGEDNTIQPLYLVHLIKISQCFFPCGKYTADPVMQFVILFFLLVCYCTQPAPMESPFPFRIVFIVVGYSCIFSTGWILLWLC